MSKDFDDLFLREDSNIKPPHIDGAKYLVNGEVKPWKGKTQAVYSPVFNSKSDKSNELGVYPMMEGQAVMDCLDAAVHAYNYGRGEWPGATMAFRIQCMEKFLAGLKAKRDEIVTLLQWEICKNSADSQKEVDRTIIYIQDTIKEAKALHNRESTFTNDSGVFAHTRRAPIGVVLCLGPFNYPFNETYTTLIPAILMGNTVVMKLPRTGVLCHFPTFDLFKDCFPKGVVNVVSGSGRETLPPIMATGKIDVFAFIGTSSAADSLQKEHPKPHRLRVVLGLEAKNPAIVLPDANLEVAVRECLLGSLSFNGQRCTAIKIIFLHKDISEKFRARFIEEVDKLKMGLPWEAGVAITPLPEANKPNYLTELITDAEAKGAKIVNKRGGKQDRTFVAPTVLFPVDKTMRVYHEEQFGPLVPIKNFEKIEEIYEYLDSSPYGQQAAIFTRDPNAASTLVDVLVNQVSRVNLNSQCQRGPDSLPFTGRKDSAYGTLSVGDALRSFSIRSLVAAKDEKESQELVSTIVAEHKSNFLRLDYLF
eukprot:TRINITY_DN1043_c0_g1_i8.p1 TRINITY_DN1043_c0_g1~~TRINITY_DN1043_c0_g1_i8.p1  ORF type:complete len:534 (-),score=126.10 TRINITY_DN1043_c0_g1_i8:14-1615(-)